MASIGLSLYFISQFPKSLFFYFIFQLHFTFNIILHVFQLYSIVVRQLDALQSGALQVSSTRLALYIVITMLLTVFPVPYFMSPWVFCDYQFVFLNPFTFLTQSPTPVPSGNHQSDLFVSLFPFCLFICFAVEFIFIDSTRRPWTLVLLALCLQRIPREMLADIYLPASSTANSSGNENLSPEGHGGCEWFTFYSKL